MVLTMVSMSFDPKESKNLAGLDDYADAETELRIRMLERVMQAQ